VGLVLSLTNPSLAGIEMMACGLPCVELASEPMVASFGADGPLILAEPDPLALAGAMESLLDDPGLRARASRAGVAATAARTWAAAAVEVEDGLRAAVRLSARS
jgi:glycosyltransferase involved in cell wall biosynthesis